MGMAIHSAPAMLFRHGPRLATTLPDTRRNGKHAFLSFDLSAVGLNHRTFDTRVTILSRQAQQAGISFAESRWRIAATTIYRAPLPGELASTVALRLARSGHQIKSEICKRITRQDLAIFVTMLCWSHCYSRLILKKTIARNVRNPTFSPSGFIDSCWGYRFT